MTAITLQLTIELTTVLCHSCGESMSHQTDDEPHLVSEVRDFLAAHGECKDLTAGRRP